MLRNKINTDMDER